MRGLGMEQVDVSGSGLIYLRDGEGGWYAAQSGYEQEEGSSEPQPTLTQDEFGHFRWHNGDGRYQVLYPISVSPNRVEEALTTIDPDYQVMERRRDGTIPAELAGMVFELKPEYQLVPVDEAHANEAWWLESEHLLIPVTGGAEGEQWAQPYRWKILTGEE
jgi:hypothetical protein